MDYNSKVDCGFVNVNISQILGDKLRAYEVFIKVVIG